MGKREEYTEKHMDDNFEENKTSQKKSETRLTAKKNGGLKNKSQKLKAKILKNYYGNPIRDMKLIAISGATGKTIVAHYVHEILRAMNEHVAVLASEQPFKTRTLHKFLSDAWKAGANYVIVTVPNEGLRDNVFYDLPVHVAAMTNFISAGLRDAELNDFLENEKTLYGMNPDYVILNKDDLNYEKFIGFSGKEGTVDYGRTSNDVKILSSKLYNKGTEAILRVSPDVISVATFLTGETVVPYMACAAAIATVLGAKNDDIINGIAEYNPE